MLQQPLRIFLFFLLFANTLLAQKNVISGEIVDTHGAPMPEVTLQIFDETKLPLTEIHTDSMGCFYVEIAEKTPFKALSIQPKYQPGTIANHINTLDLIHMSRHILNISPFELPHQTLAADVNHSQTVTSADIMQLRNWLLGKQPDSLHRTMYERFAPNSWQFIAGTAPLDDVGDWDGNKKASIRLKRSELPRHHLTWVGYTSGDVAPSAPNQRPAAALEWPVLIVEKNTPTTTVPVVYRGTSPAIGLQFGLSFDPNVWELIAPSLGDVVGIGATHFGLDHQLTGKITFCWLAFEGETFPVQPGETLFHLTFRAKKWPQVGHSTLKLDTTLLRDGIWTSGDVEHSILPVTSPVLPSAPPPPVTVEHLPTRTTLYFNSDRAGKIRMVLSNGWGHQITMRDVPIQAGAQAIPLDEFQQQAPGVYSWWIKLPNGKMYDGRLVKIEER